MKATAILLAFGALLGACTHETASDDPSRGSLEDTFPSGETDAAHAWITIGTDAIEVIHEAMARGDLPGELETYDTTGEATVLRVATSQLPALTRVMHDHLHRCGGYMVHASFDDAAGALETSVRKQAAESSLVSYTLNNASVVNALLSAVQEPQIRSTINTLSSYSTRYYTTQSGVDAAHWLRDRWQQLTSGRPDATVETYQHTGYPQPSVILTIPGDSVPGEVIVLGAHLDSTTTSGSPLSPSPGADDDASGIATITEIARVALSSGFKPDRTVKFIGYAAEEVGLRGSGDIAAAYKTQGVNVVGVLQLDMTNYKGSTKDIALVTDYTNAAQNQFLRNLITTYTSYTTLDTSCGYGCSDHASWHNRGFVASIPFESSLAQSNPHIHSGADTLAQSGGNANHALKFAKLGAAYMAELAKGALDYSDDGEDPPTMPTPTTTTHTGTVAQGQSVQYGPFPTLPGTSITAALTGTGDADLYVRFGAPPTTSAYTCRPYQNGTNETCALTSPASNSSAYVMIRGYSSANYTLTVTRYAP
ncbi:M20/M25/M40 family metallo-hydrolase [Chondromyces apiculatus]|uniref:Bacterial leucyl aminopeptidase n=1 Tax=Chondromyces apiculatus DSM 436 TaxID=1192034 RepID=A0A017T1G8_9BACT|nr:M20/M25/M40 family metallo-hydrolase [Chondromyces apiculatus]EYF03084.1 Bacterial leucyl aminopeptidase [Chondromyces apiculatus DSM 436]